jgi:hypothetical protein
VFGRLQSLAPQILGITRILVGVLQAAAEKHTCAIASAS